MNRSRFKLDQNHAPIHEALEKFLRMRVVPFDVPGHKRGRGNPEQKNWQQMPLEQRMHFLWLEELQAQCRLWC